MCIKRTRDGEEYWWASKLEVHNKELHDLYYSSNIIWVVKGRSMKWAGM